MSRSARWVFTIQHYTPDVIDSLRSLADTPKVVFLVYGKEVAPTTNTPHLQGYIEYNDRKRLGYVCKDLGGKAHCEPAYGDFYSNLRYCTKEGDFWMSDTSLLESYNVSRRIVFPEYWTDIEKYSLRRCCTKDWTDDDIRVFIYAHDKYVNFLLTQFADYSRNKLMYTNWESDNDD